MVGAIGAYQNAPLKYGSCRVDVDGLTIVETMGNQPAVVGAASKRPTANSGAVGRSGQSVVPSSAVPVKAPPAAVIVFRIQAPRCVTVTGVVGVNENPVAPPLGVGLSERTGPDANAPKEPGS